MAVLPAVAAIQAARRAPLFQRAVARAGDLGRIGRGEVAVGFRNRHGGIGLTARGAHGAAGIKPRPVGGWPRLRPNIADTGPTYRQAEQMAPPFSPHPESFRNASRREQVWK